MKPFYPVARRLSGLSKVISIVSLQGTFELTCSYEIASFQGVTAYHPKLAGDKPQEARLEYRHEDRNFQLWSSAKLVLRIPAHEVKAVRVTQLLVHDTGYLLEKELLGGLYPHALSDAHSGKKPAFLDDSPFLKVSETYAGEALLLVGNPTGGHQGHLYRRDGTRVSRTIEHPLSRSRWKRRR